MLLLAEVTSISVLSEFEQDKEEQGAPQPASATLAISSFGPSPCRSAIARRAHQEDGGRSPGCHHAQTREGEAGGRCRGADVPEWVQQQGTLGFPGIAHPLTRKAEEMQQTRTAPVIQGQRGRAGGRNPSHSAKMQQREEGKKKEEKKKESKPEQVGGPSCLQAVLVLQREMTCLT